MRMGEHSTSIIARFLCNGLALQASMTVKIEKVSPEVELQSGAEEKQPWFTNCQRRSKNRPRGGAKVGHLGPRMRPAGGRSPSGGLICHLSSVLLQADCHWGFNPLFDRTKKQMPARPGFFFAHARRKFLNWPMWLATPDAAGGATPNSLVASSEKSTV